MSSQGAFHSTADTTTVLKHGFPRPQTLISITFFGTSIMSDVPCSDTLVRTRTMAAVSVPLKQRTPNKQLSIALRNNNNSIRLLPPLLLLQPTSYTTLDAG